MECPLRRSLSLVEVIPGDVGKMSPLELVFHVKIGRA